MNWKDSIRSSIRAIADSDKIADKPDVFYAEVESVNEEARTCSCTLISGTSDISLDTVNLMAEVNDGMLRIPTIGSTVYILSTINVTPWVDVFSQLDKIFYVAGGSLFNIDNDGIKLNVAIESDAIPEPKNFGGIIKLVDPDNSDAGVLARLNKIENWQNDFTSLWNSFCAVYVPGSPSTTGLPATLSTSTTTDLTPTQRTDLENPTVQHGNAT